LQEQSGARIKIDNGDGSGDERIVNIFGEASKVAIAKQLVEDKVAEGVRKTNYVYFLDLIFLIYIYL
jgi:hypothetical protein